jgi:putative endonuclease
MWHVYVLESKIDSDKYVGMTNNLKRRFDMHNSGKVPSTRNRYPFKIIYIETYINQHDAAAREKFLKTGWGKNYLARVLKNYLTAKKLGG